MSTLNADLYDALRAAKVDEALARRAAESVTSQPQRTEGLEREMREGFQRMQEEGRALRAEFQALRAEFHALRAEFHALEVKVARLYVQMKILIAGVAALVLRSFFFPV